MKQKRHPITWDIVFLIGTVLHLGATTTSTETNSTCTPDWATDAFCDSNNNSEECGYDGGDCCRCSCEDTDDYFCGVNGFDCQDPDQASCDSSTNTTAVNNNEDCRYDGGDCCSCTCDPDPGSCEVDDSIQCLNTSVACYPWAEDDDSGSDTGGSNSRWLEATWEIAVTLGGAVIFAIGTALVKKWRDRGLQEADTNPAVGESVQHNEARSSRPHVGNTPTAPSYPQVSPPPYRQVSPPPYRSPSSIAPVNTAVIDPK